MGAQVLTAVVIGSAPGPRLDYLRPYLTGEEIIICADGGLQRALDSGLKPDWYVGDSDSGGYAPPDIPHWLLPSEKDLTDLEMGVEKALELGAKRIILCGCTGGRADHHLINLFLLEQIAQRGAAGILLDQDNEISYLSPGKYRIANAPKYHYFSLVSLDRELTGLTLGNCKYQLTAPTDVPRGSSLTVSNEFTPDGPVELQFSAGAALLIRSVPDPI